MSQNRFFNSFLFVLAMTMLSASAAFAQSKVTTKPAPLVMQRQAVVTVKRPATTTMRPVKMNPVRPLPKTFTPLNARETLFTAGTDTHPVQFHRGDGQSLPPIYATGAGPGVYTNPLLVLQSKKGRK